jgi:phosphate transport system substrate-binding protein
MRPAVASAVAGVLVGLLLAACSTGIVTNPPPGAPISPAPSLTGAGSTFAAPLYQDWGGAFDALRHIAVSYSAVGSSAGITDIVDRTVDFGASDAPYAPPAPPAKAIIDIPTAISAVVLTYHLPSLPAGVTLNFTGQTVVDIFSRVVTRWDAAEIAAENPGIRLPHRTITVVHRSDGSGTTAIFSSYLSAISPAWAGTYGSGTTVAWPTSEIGGKGSSGVEADVSQYPYSIGYVELTYAVQNKTPEARIANAAGAFVTPSLASVQAAVRQVVLPPARPGTGVIFNALNEPGAGSYPIAGPTYILAYRQQVNAAAGKALAQYLTWGLTAGQRDEAALQYVRLPPAIDGAALEAVGSLSYRGVPLASPGA